MKNSSYHLGCILLIGHILLIGASTLEGIHGEIPEPREFQHKIVESPNYSDDFFQGVEDEFGRVFPRVSVTCERDMESGPFFNHINEHVESRAGVSKSSNTNIYEVQAAATSSSGPKRLKKAQKTSSKTIIPDDSVASQGGTHIARDYGCPDPRWPVKMTGYYDVYNTAHAIYNFYADKSDVSVDTKFHTRCNQHVAIDLLSTNVERIKQAVKWIQVDYSPPAHTQELGRLLGESLMWGLVYDIAGRHGWQVDDVSRALAQVMDEKTAFAIRVGRKKLKDYEMRHIEELICEQMQARNCHGE